MKALAGFLSMEDLLHVRYLQKVFEILRIYIENPQKIFEIQKAQGGLLEKENLHNDFSIGIHTKGPRDIGGLKRFYKMQETYCHISIRYRTIEGNREIWNLQRVFQIQKAYRRPEDGLLHAENHKKSFGCSSPIEGLLDIEGI